MIEDRRCLYTTDEDIKDLSLDEIRYLKRIKPLYLSPIKVSHQIKINVNILRTKIVGDIGFRIKKIFKNHGMYED